MHRAGVKASMAPATQRCRPSTDHSPESAGVRGAFVPCRLAGEIDGPVAFSHISLPGSVNCGCIKPEILQNTFDCPARSYGREIALSLSTRLLAEQHT